LDQFVDLFADDLPLVGLFAGRNAAFEQVPVHLRRGRGRLLAPTPDRLSLFTVAEDLESD
jgi:hypothetical protein